MKTTALHELHTQLGAKLVDFAGWDMPVQFEGGLKEHHHTRGAASLFDVSHMGQVLIRPRSGDMADAAAALETLIPASVAGLEEGRQRYGLLTNDAGGVVDDLMFAHHGDRFFLVLNASRTDADLALLRTLEDVTVEHLTDRSLLALQGPKAEETLATLVPEVPAMRFMDSLVLPDPGRVRAELWISRSGYTGEDGFEISLPNEQVEAFARALLALDDVAPAGLAARDSLRLEAGMCLYGHELAEDITPVEAGIAWAIPKVRRSGGSRAGGFPGAEVILRQLDEGAARERVGLRPEGRAVAREGAPLFADEQGTEQVGVITSGGFGATAGGPVAMGLVPTGATAGATFYTQVRGKALPLTVTELPFVPHQYKR
ncbi:glycine cleavage system aminomethyltransferase GcvT [Tessaracoccus sp. ZS01]|uniref:glycine cleavage system aminomethyltransferase GcvT n=1 Tax=Tessaracoccus sp. ZS01 TaxID=1906324 RepID=UPI00096D3454|nr:glycine cleavage system aminomethyltransferase GcvT [Tessaracoccus sp. ZS01]MCG6566200.1 glycine cleavage system aminomethyltransferase T [Tessaracoccus sp. ZS01]OMG58685.1 glycine cleavage system protein T [Tessaracoccus sp. ZS01]